MGSRWVFTCTGYSLAAFCSFDIGIFPRNCHGAFVFSDGHVVRTLFLDGNKGRADGRNGACVLAKELKSNGTPIDGEDEADQRLRSCSLQQDNR